MKVKWLTFAFAVALIANAATQQVASQQDAALQQDAAPIGITNLQVVDANNKSLGTAHFTASVEMSVVMQVNEHFVLLPVFPYGFAPTPVNVGFTTPDCTGQGYLISPFSFELLLFTPAAITLPGSVLWIPSGEPLEIIHRQSTLVPPDEYRPNGCYYNVEPFLDFGIPATATEQLDTMFTPPFRLKSFNHIHRQTKRTFSGPALQR